MRRWTHIVLVVAACSPAASGETDGAGSSTTVDASTTGAPTTGGGPADLPPIDPCLDGDVFVATQEELDALAGCVEIPGKLTIVGDQIGSLVALSELRVIGGGLFIGRDGGVLTTPRITSLAGLEGLESVPSVGLAWLDQLSNVEALAGLTAVPGELSLYQLPKLAALEGLHNVESVDSLSISACPSLVDLSGLRGLARVASRIGFSELRLTDFTGLAALTEVGAPGGEPAWVLIRDNPLLLTLDGLEGVVWHDALHLDVVNNAKFHDLGALSGAVELGGFELADNDYVLTLAGIESLATVTGALILDSNYRLKDISALAAVESVLALRVVGDQSFFDLSPLVSLKSAGSFTVEYSDLVELGPLPALQSLGDLTIRGNSDLVSISGVSGVTGLARLTIESTSVLADLSPLAGVTALESLRIRENKAITELSGLGAVAEITGLAEISGNAAITAVAGMAALKTVGGRLKVMLNPALPQPDAVQWGAGVAAALGRKIAGNKDAGPPLDPCPWQNDVECDDVMYGLGICVDGSDPADCMVSD